MPGIKIGRWRGQKQQRAREVVWLAQASLGNPGQESLANLARLVGVFEHPGCQRGAENRRRYCVHGYSRSAELAAERFSDAVDRRFRCAIGRVSCRMTKKAAR